jgi:hypothetical protein
MRWMTCQPIPVCHWFKQLSPCHRMLINSTNEGPQYVSMLWLLGPAPNRRTMYPLRAR